MCIRALDYLPPVDVTFFDFLRALVTADYDFVPDDKYNYRVAIIEAFTAHGIRPGSDVNVSSLSEDGLRWAGFPNRVRQAKQYAEVVDGLRAYAQECVTLEDRKSLFCSTRDHRRHLNRLFSDAFDESASFRKSLGLMDGGFEVHSLRQAMRARPNGRVEPEVIVSLVQSRSVRSKGVTKHRRLGGVTLVVNLASESNLPRYRIAKPIGDADRQKAMADFATENAQDPLRQLYLGPDRERFAALHHLADS